MNIRERSKAAGPALGGRLGGRIAALIVVCSVAVAAAGCDKIDGANPSPAPTITQTAKPSASQATPSTATGHDHGDEEEGEGDHPSPVPTDAKPRTAAPDREGFGDGTAPPPTDDDSTGPGSGASVGPDGEPISAELKETATTLAWRMVSCLDGEYGYPMTNALQQEVKCGKLYGGKEWRRLYSDDALKLPMPPGAQAIVDNMNKNKYWMLVQFRDSTAHHKLGDTVSVDVVYQSGAFPKDLPDKNVPGDAPLVIRRVYLIKEGGKWVVLAATPLDRYESFLKSDVPLYGKDRTR